MVLHVNGIKQEVAVDAGENLLSVLRYHLHLTGSKYGCGEGACGACMVLINGTAVPSCITTVQAAADKEIITIEGLEQNGKLHPVQQAFLETDPFQCSYCAPGMIISAVALLRTNPNPSPQAIATGMNRNICRCGTYPHLIKAIQKAAIAKK